MKYFIVLLLVTGSVVASETDRYLRDGEVVTPHYNNVFRINPETTEGTVDRRYEYNQPETVGHRPDPFAIKDDDRRYEVDSGDKPCFQIICK